jgi:hypothetical protein
MHPGKDFGCLQARRPRLKLGQEFKESEELQGVQGEEPRAWSVEAPWVVERASLARPW